MFSIAPYFDSLKSYVDYIDQYGSKNLSPSRCKDCGKDCMRCHGFYPRKADRENHGDDSLNPIPIFRFICTFCKKTCSVLPLCIPPRRWYLWSVQQIALLLTILENSWRFISMRVPPSRTTIRRWYKRFDEMFLLHMLHIRSRTPELGRHSTTFNIFWKACLNQMSLSQAMFWVHCAGELIP